MNVSRILLTLALSGAVGTANAGEWAADPARSSLRFIGEAQGESFEGRFARFEAKVTFDPSQLDAAEFDVEIKLSSADSQNEERDELLQSGDFFDSASKPDAHYRATRFEALGDGRFRALGELELKGTTRPIPLDFSWVTTETGVRLDGSAEVSRLQFGIGTGDWADTDEIADSVQIKTSLILHPVPTKP